MEELNKIVSENLMLIILAVVALFFFLKPKNTKEEKEEDRPILQPTAKAKEFIELWPEVYMIPLLIAIAALVNYALMKLFPDAIFLGPEQIQVILYKTVAAFMAYFFFFIRDRLDFKEAWNWYKSPERITEYQTLTPWQKRLTFYWRLSVFVLVFALV